jgi:ribonuclease VapC
MTVVVDSSALVAFLLGEDRAGDIEAVLDRETGLRMSSVNWVETAMVLLGRGFGSALEEARRVRQDASITIEAVDETIAEHAIDAFRRYGKGRHPARLNFGDCFAYATAKAIDAPLLFTGNDFRATDVTPAL